MNMDRTLLGNVHGHLKLVLNIINPSSMEGVLDLSDHISVEIISGKPTNDVQDTRMNALENDVFQAEVIEVRFLNEYCSFYKSYFILDY